MGKDILKMTKKERDRMGALKEVLGGKAKRREVARVLGISERQVRRSLRRFEQEGDKGLVHRLRGRGSNRRVGEEVREAIVGLKEGFMHNHVYDDWGATMMMEELQGLGHQVSRETVRRVLIEKGWHKPRSRKEAARTRRERRECFGEMVQMDTSEHLWLEGRGESCVLISMIDDATSTLYARFYRTDSTMTNMDMLRRYIELYGRPRSVYADRASHFKTTRCATVEEDLEGVESETQIQRALRELGIVYIPAGSPQAKGRVERGFGTLQNRLVKYLRKGNVSTMQEANTYLEEEFLGMWKKRWSVSPSSQFDAHRPIEGLPLEAILSRQESRVVANDYTIQWHNRVLQIELGELPAGLRKSKVIVEDRLDHTQAIRFRDHYLPFHEIDARAKAQVQRQPVQSQPLSLSLSGCIPVSDQALQPDKHKGLEQSQPLATPATERSGCSPAEPYPPDGRNNNSTTDKKLNPRHKPGQEHPWNKYSPFRKKRTFLLCKKADISTLR